MKKLVALLLSLVLLVGMSAAALADVTVSWYNFSDAFSSFVRDYAIAKYADLGINAVMKDSNNVQQTQNDDLQTAVVTGTEALVVQMVDSGAYATAKNILQMGVDAGIPVVFFSRVMSTNNAECKDLIATYDKTIYVGTDPAEAGVYQGQMIGEYLVANYDALDLNGDGVITYVMLKGDQANQEAIYRTMYSVIYANEALAAAGKPALKFYDDAAVMNYTADGQEEGYYIVDPTASWSQTFGNETITTILAQYNESNGNMPELIIANNDDMALGAIKALQVAGYNTAGATVIPVFGVDATDMAKEAIAAGQMIGTVEQSSKKLGETVAIVTDNMLKGNELTTGLEEGIELRDGWQIVVPYSKYTGE